MCSELICAKESLYDELCNTSEFLYARIAKSLICQGATVCDAVVRHSKVGIYPDHELVF